jgi:putative ABC transport system ATP-binding protein
MIELKNINIMYEDKSVIENCNITINDGECCVIYGESGSGKSTLLKCISGMLEPTNGGVLIENQNIYEISKHDRCDVRYRVISIFPQFPKLIESINVIENIQISSRIGDIVNTSENRDTIMNRLGIQDKRYNYPAELSGGEKRRVELARVFFENKKYTILDEPTANLDKKNRERVYNCINDILQKKGALIISTHDEKFLDIADVVFEIKDRQLIMRENISKFSEIIS